MTVRQFGPCADLQEAHLICAKIICLLKLYEDILMGHRMIQGEIVAQILMHLEKNCGNYTVVKFILCKKKKDMVGPAQVSGGSFDMRINLLSMPFIFGYVFRAWENIGWNNYSNINENGEKLWKLQCPSSYFVKKKITVWTVISWVKIEKWLSPTVIFLTKYEVQGTVTYTVCLQCHWYLTDLFTCIMLCSLIMP